MDIQNIVTEQDTETLDAEIAAITAAFTEEHYLNNDEAEHLEMIAAKSMVLGELYERAKWQAKTQAVPEWISVEDRLPSDGQNIIAFDAIKHCVFKDGEFLQGYFEPDTGHEYTEPVDVTHWIAIETQEPTND